MKLNNKILTGVFALLLIILVYQKFLKSPNTSSFKQVIAQLDTTLVNKIILQNKDNAPVTLIKNEDGWAIETAQGNTYSAVGSSVRPLLAAATGIKTQQLVSRSEEKHSEYELDDRSGKKLEYYNNDKLLGAFYVGRFNFDQANRTAKTYVRESNSNDIYTTEGFLGMSVDRKEDDFRNKQLLPGFSASEVNRIEIESDDYSVSFEKDNYNQWQDDQGRALDSLRMAEYLQVVESANGRSFSDKSDESEQEIANISFFSTIEEPPHQIKIFRIQSSEFLVQNVNQSEQSFVSDSSGLFNKVYLSINDLLNEL